MKQFLTRAVLGAGLAASTLAACAPAEAQWRGGYRGFRGYHHHGDRTGAALLGGIVGLGVGAAIASSSRPRYYYDGGYYAPPPPRVVYRERYYAPPPPPTVVYRDTYYGGGYGGYGGGYGYNGYYGY